MSRIVTATFENGVLRPHEELGLAPGTTVRLTVDRMDDVQPRAQRACDELVNLCAELPIQSDGFRLTRDQLHERS